MCLTGLSKAHGSTQFTVPLWTCNVVTTPDVDMLNSANGANGASNFLYFVFDVFLCSSYGVIRHKVINNTSSYF